MSTRLQTERARIAEITRERDEALRQLDEARDEVKGVKGLWAREVGSAQKAERERDEALAREARAMSRAGEYEGMYQREAKRRLEVEHQRDALKAALEKIAARRDARGRDVAAQIAIEALVDVEEA